MRYSAAPDDISDALFWKLSQCELGEWALRNMDARDARLAEVGPEMLIALEDTREWIATGKVDGVSFDEMSVCDRLDAVIAKAKGGNHEQAIRHAYCGQGVEGEGAYGVGG